MTPNKFLLLDNFIFYTLVLGFIILDRSLGLCLLKISPFTYIPFL